MAQFRGTIQGRRGDASRLGDKSSGLTVRAASWEGAVETHLYHKNGRDHAIVALVRHHGAGVNRVIYDGPVDGAEHDA